MYPKNGWQSLKSPKPNQFTIDRLDTVIVAVPVPGTFVVAVEAEVVARNSCASDNYYRPSCAAVLVDRESRFARCSREIVAQVRGHSAAAPVATELVAVAHRIASGKIADDCRSRTWMMAAAAIGLAQDGHSCSSN